MGIELFGLRPAKRELSLKIKQLHLEVEKEMEENNRIRTNESLREFTSFYEDKPSGYTSNPGSLFMVNWTGWYQILKLCNQADNLFKLNIDFTGWRANDGNGLGSQEECNTLADSIEYVIEKTPEIDNSDPKYFYRFVAFLRHCGGFEIW